MAAELSLVSESSELRQETRLSVDLTAEFRNAAGQRCKGQVTNVSLDGIQVRCHCASGQLLHPKGGRVCHESVEIVQISMKLPTENGEKQFVAGAELLYVTASDAGSNCVLGFKFLDLRPTPQKALENFLLHQDKSIHAERSAV
ncbi:MAG: PilZ domain-containing protein [Pseudomonadota bacterium]